MLFRYLNEPIIILYLLPVILITLSVHEFAHAYSSYKLGDPTAKNMGRLTLNPLRHLDPLGTLMLLVSFFGWAKPVPINPMYYKNTKRGTMIVSLAGPLSNVFMALLSAFAIAYISVVYGTPNIYSINKISIIYYFSQFSYIININLAVFNILPIPPLDGSKILSGLLPNKYYYKMMQYENYIGIGFLVIVFIFPTILQTVMSPFVWAIQKAISFVVITILDLLPLTNVSYTSLLVNVLGNIKIC
jgi:Zn-dependent protease